MSSASGFSVFPFNSHNQARAKKIDISLVYYIIQLQNECDFFTCESVKKNSRSLDPDHKYRLGKLYFYIFQSTPSKGFCPVDRVSPVTKPPCRVCHNWNIVFEVISFHTPNYKYLGMAFWRIIDPLMQPATFGPC